MLVVFWAVFMAPVRSNSKPSTPINSFAVFVIVLVGISPILKNLTRDISDDTIWAFTTGMLLGNLLFHDYGTRTDTHTRFILDLM